MGAAYSGYTDLVWRLVGAGADVNKTADDGSTALINAAWKGYADVAEALSAGRRFRPNSSDGRDRTALIIASALGHVDIVNVLLSFRAAVDHRDVSGSSALMYAASNNRRIVIRSLIAAHADVNAYDNCGCTALMAAAKNGYLAPAKMLVRAGANVNLQNRKNETALILAQINGHTRIVQLLTETGDQQ
jgi:hypothetical protein